MKHPQANQRYYAVIGLEELRKAMKNLLGLFVFSQRLKTSTSGTQEALLFQATCLVRLFVGQIFIA